jgi:hypothetical protein
MYVYMCVCVHVRTLVYDILSLSNELNALVFCFKSSLCLYLCMKLPSVAVSDLMKMTICEHGNLLDVCISVLSDNSSVYFVPYFQNILNIYYTKVTGT